MSHACDRWRRLADRITDKLPANFGISGLHPSGVSGAHIVHVRRDPVDTCFSCYANLFSQGIEFSNDLGELGRYYRAYASSDGTLAPCSAAGGMLEVQYEELVENFEDTIAADRRVLRVGMGRAVSFISPDRARGTHREFGPNSPTSFQDFDRALVAL